MSPLDNKSAELVLTVPNPYDAELAYWMRARMTVSVLTLLVAEAKREVIIAAPFIQRDEGISKPPLSDALEAALRRGVRVHIASTGASLQQLNMSVNLERYRSQLYFYQPQNHIADPNRLGSHAKFCLCDNRQAYVGSANLTAPGLNQNFELGLLVHNAIAQQIYDLWRHLLERGFFIEVHV